MKRIVDQYLRDWKQRPDRKALLLRGARQVGKTYAVRAFGKSYDEFAEINLDYLLLIDNVVVPVEVKSGATGRLRSLRAFLDEKRGAAPYGIRFCGQPSSIHDDLHSYPVYAVPHVLRSHIPRGWF